MSLFSIASENTLVLVAASMDRAIGIDRLSGSAEFATELTFVSCLRHARVVVFFLLNCLDSEWFVITRTHQSDQALALSRL